MSVAVTGQTVVARLLIDNGANVGERNNEGTSPLHYAALFGHVGVARFLIDGGADPNEKNDAGITPLDLALAGGRSTTANLLAANGACRSGYGNISGFCVPETGALEGGRRICEDVFRGRVEDEVFCSEIDINDTFCIIGSRDAFPCQGLFMHVRTCNLLNRRALDPWHCAGRCVGGKKAAGDECR